MTRLEQDLVFGALTRPQMFAGVTYGYFVLNAVVTAPHRGFVGEAHRLRGEKECVAFAPFAL